MRQRMTRNRILVVDRFAPEGRGLRSHFEERFANPHGADSGRFVWDWWHVPGQYTLLRTPAYHFFPAPLYRAFHQRLFAWGRKNLGCQDISPPWLSLYVDGCRQEFHADLPHGPFAFVYSLTPEKRRFRGGETLILKEPILDFWRNLDRFRGLEEDQVLETIEPRFNRLTVFDPRVPHAVRRVENTWEPREGRLVIHGWFTDPKPLIDGPLRRPELQALIDGLGKDMDARLAGLPPLRGMLSLGFRVLQDGSVSAARILASTLVATEGPSAPPASLARWLLSRLRSHRFGRQKKGPSTITLPLVFGA
jgi:hypothetical protein